MTLAKAGKHPNPAVQPLVTIEEPSADTAWMLFWEVGDLRQLAKQDRVAITSLTAEGQNKPLAKGLLPHGAMLVKAAFLWVPRPRRIRWRLGRLSPAQVLYDGT
jgi:hypothetical protein